ncbi:MAG: tetraacyldisaccharide 4'-kinase [Pseudolabrys sp.]
MREPGFWWRKTGLQAALLAPVAAGYGLIAARRMAKAGTRADVPVLCVGNFTLGGTGKTPTVIAIAHMLAAAGETPFCLSRGYGGNAAGPKLVDVHHDPADQVGDEALLLARAAPTIVSRDRVAGTRMAKAEGASVIVMDDGLQNPSLRKDFTIAVIDGTRGIGNARVFPAGPLRAPLQAQLDRTDALLVMGGADGAHDVMALAAKRGLPMLHGRLVPDPGAVEALQGRKALAFAGIGNPEKFFKSAADAGIAVTHCRAFPDHHRFTAEEAAKLEMDADSEGLSLLTTEKDRARMTGDPALHALATQVHVLPVTLELDEAETLQALVTDALRR